MNDDQVLQRALEDETGTTSHIEELRAQIAQQERHLEEVDQFIAMYRRYASAEAVNTNTPVPAFAYSSD